MAYNFEKEKREAIDAGNKALESLRTAKENLDRAHNWGLFDMFAGGLISSLAKRSKMNQARQHMEQAKWDLRNFSEELKDVNMISHLDIETNDFLSFADWFFDGAGSHQYRQRPGGGSNPSPESDSAGIGKQLNSRQIPILDLSFCNGME